MIMRKSFGWQKPVSNISLSTFEKCTGLHRRNFKHDLDALCSRGIILKDSSGYITQYGIQTDYKKWQTSMNFNTHKKKNKTKEMYFYFLATNFELFFKEYPKKAAKRDSQKAWSQLFNGCGSKHYLGELTENLMNEILTAVKRQCKKNGMARGKW